MKFELGLIALACVTLIMGCSDSEKGAGDKKMSALADNAVFMKVNGAEFRRHDFEVASSLWDKMTRMRSKDSLVGANSKAERSVELRRPFVVSDIKRRALMADFARENNVTATAENVKKAETLFLANMDRKNSTVEKVAAEIGGEEAVLLKQYLQGDAVDLTLRERFDTEHRMNITDEDVMVVSNRYLKSLEMAEVSNKVERALLEKALAEIKSGVDFVEVAKKYSLVPQEALEWAELDQDDIAEEHVALTEWVKTAKVGDVSGILELEDGYGIAKVTAYERESADEDADDKDDEPPEENWTVVRICRKSWEGFDPMTRQEIVDELIKVRSREVQKKIGDAIMAKAVIEWPVGTNLFEKVKENVKAQRPNRSKADVKNEVKK